MRLRKTGLRRLGVTVLLPMTVGILGCLPDATPEEHPSARHEPLYLDATAVAWPGQSIPVCWTADSVDTPDDVPSMIMRSWTQSTGLAFKGWTTCPANTDNMVAVTVAPGGGGRSYTFGYKPTGTGFVLGSDSTRLPVAVHEMGHTLGFRHEMARPGFVESDPICHEADDPGDSLNTPIDPESIMAYSYCHFNEVISFWDGTGAQNAYGRANYFADVNGDGRSDAIVVNPASVAVRLSTGANLASVTDWTGGAFYGQKGTFFADVNGDHRADAIAVDTDGAWVRLSTGVAFASPGTKWAFAGFFGQRATAFADVTGDGLADAIAIRDDGIWVMPSTGTAFAARDQRWMFSLFAKDFVGQYGTFFADVTGDGKADAVVVNGSDVQVMASTGTAFGPAVSWFSGTGISSSQARHLTFADVTGDGRADAVIVKTNATQVAVSTGSSFLLPADWTAQGFWGEHGVFFADLTGDGRADAIAVSEDVSSLQSSGSSFAGAPVTWSSNPYYATRGVPLCVNGVKDGGETDVDCGGTCVPCALGKTCTRLTDCATGTCVSGVCVTAPTCSDGVKNGRETDVDCGGFCQVCADHRRCMDSSDCESANCGVDDVSGQPVIACRPGNCSDGIRDTGEAGIDCGGSTTCPRCPLGQPCGTATDCASGYCKKNVCTVLPGCNNGVKDGRESDVDCGGSDATCARCADHRHCAHPSDCASGNCGVELLNGMPAIACLPATCSDGIKNGGESDVDCGGATTCPRCAISKTCTAPTDCQNGSCAAGICQMTTCFDGVRDGKESDVDCGGIDGLCPRCADHRRCVHAVDCASHNCGVELIGGVPTIACLPSVP